MIEVRDCYKNVKLHKKNIGLFPYRIVNHPIKDVHEDIEIVYVDFWTDRSSIWDDGDNHYHFESNELGDIIEADKYCIYIKGDTFEGKTITEMTVRIKYFYDIDIPENIPLNEAQIPLKLNESAICDKVQGILENNDLNGVLSVFEGPEVDWVDTSYLADLGTWTTVDTENGIYEYRRPTSTSWTIRPSVTESSSFLWSDADVATLREIIEEHRNNE